MFVVSILAIFVLAQIIAYRNERKLADTLGMVCCGFILVLYLLAFFRLLNWIDYISVPIVIVSMFWIWRNGLARRLLGDFCSIQNLCVLGVLVLIAFTQIGRIALSADDIGYWATDVKAMWINNGLAWKYGNVAPEFGYYPPALQLFKWFFLHIGSYLTGEYVEGLGFSGYICLNYILLLPLISKIDRVVKVKEKIIAPEDDNVGVKLAKNKRYYASDRKLISKYKVKIAGNNSELVGERVNVVGVIALFFANILACICLVLLPTVVSGGYFEGTSADTTIGILTGVLLLFVWDIDREHTAFYFARISLLGCVLVLCSPYGVAWGILVIIFMLINLIYDRRGEKFNQASLFETTVRYGVYSVLTWLAALVSWLIYCLINGRFSLTSKFGDIINSTVGVGYYVSDKIIEYLTRLLVSPLHTNRTWLIDLSMVLCMIFLLFAIYVMGKKDIISKSYGKLLQVFTLVSFVVIYAVIFVVHLTVASISNQNLFDENVIDVVMNRSMPCALGILILIIGIFLMSEHGIDEGRPVVDDIVREQIVANNFKHVRIIYAVAVVVVLLCFNYKESFRGLWEYRNTLETDYFACDGVVDDEEQVFINTVVGNQELIGKRVLYLKDSADVRWSHNKYINYKVVPISVEYGAVSAEASAEDLDNLIMHSHAKYLYVEDIEGISERLGFVQEWEYSDEQDGNRLYRILENGKIEPYRATIQE